MTSAAYLIKEAVQQAGADNESAPASDMKMPIAMALGISPMLGMIGRSKTQNLNRVGRARNVDDLVRQSRLGDVVLTSSKAPISGFQIGGTLLGGTPFNHAEMVTRTPYSKIKGTGFAGVFNNGAEGLRDKQTALIMRPRNLAEATEQQKKLVNHESYENSFRPYDDTKILKILGTRLSIPDAVSKIIKPGLCTDGNVCSTSPSDALRKSGVDPKLNAPAGLELPADYLRSENYEPVMLSGRRPDMQGARRNEILLRAGLGAGLGLGAHKVMSDVQEGDYISPAAGLAGAAAGGALGYKVDNAATFGVSKRIKELLPKRAVRPVKRGLSQIANKYNLLPTVGGIAGGGLLSYIASRLTRNANKKKAENINAQEELTK